jgi:hypothetical protein
MVWTIAKGTEYKYICLWINNLQGTSDKSSYFLLSLFLSRSPLLDSPTQFSSFPCVHWSRTCSNWQFRLYPPKNTVKPGFIYYFCMSRHFFSFFLSFFFFFFYQMLSYRGICIDRNKCIISLITVLYTNEIVITYFIYLFIYFFFFFLIYFSK